MSQDFFAEYLHQTGVKHKILEDYLKRWMSIQAPKKEGSRPMTFGYIDTFAGKGRYETGEEGSPLIAMRIGEKVHNSRRRLANLHCLFIERDPGFHASLTYEVESARSLYPSVVVETPRRGAFEDFQNEIREFADGVSAALFFIDPLGYSGIPADFIAGLIDHGRDEVLVNFMSPFVNRAISNELMAAALTRAYVGEHWRLIADDKDREEKAVILYGNRIREFSKKKHLYIFPVAINRESSERHAYHLIHVSQHPSARLAFERAVQRTRISELELPFSLPQIEEELARNLTSVNTMEALFLAGRLWEQEDFQTSTWRQIGKALETLETGRNLEIETCDGRKRRKGSVPKEKDIIRSKMRS